MARQDERYDKKSKTMWLFRDYDEAETLVPNEELTGWSKAVRQGETQSGEPLKAVNYVFANDATAEYNHSALSFAQVGTHVGTLERPEAFDGGEDAPSFSTREDFGI